MGLIKEFRDFAMKGNVVDMAVGVIIGGAFGKIVSTLVDKVMMPPIGYLTGGVDFKDKTFKLLEKGTAGAVNDVVIGYGEFINTIIQFIIVAFCLFMVIKAMNTAKTRFEKQKEAAPPPPPPAPAPSELYLKEIRDLLAKR
ncbi:MAG: large-conductance mechanosensitive channel protein MscL [Phycisphaerales bacterium]|jgi:large conductance mechanosensitive channel|nr:large-conductance mechanosensitive channel protein MscL [Phycisphaerales bacterium]